MSGVMCRSSRVCWRASASSTNTTTVSSRSPIAVGFGERCGEPLRQQPRAGRRHGAVDRGQQRAAPLARERAHEFEVRPRRLVDRQGRALRLAERRRQRRPLAELGALDVGDAGRRGVQFEPRQRAERLAGGDGEIIAQPPLGGGAVEHVAGQRRHRRQRAQIRRQLRIAVERVGDDDLARLKPRDLGRQAERSHSAMRNSPVEMSIQASAKRLASASAEARARGALARR